MAKAAVSIDANTFQFFTRNPRGGAQKALDPHDIAAFEDYEPEHGIEVILGYAPPSTPNPASDKQAEHDFTMMVLAEDLARMAETPQAMYTLQPGSALGKPVDEALARVAAALNDVITPSLGTPVLVQTMAGEGTQVGSTFEQLASILDQVELDDHVGVLFDACRVWGAGYDIVDDLDGVVDEFDRVIGIDKLRAIHLNDSKDALGLAQGPPCAYRRGADRLRRPGRAREPSETARRAVLPGGARRDAQGVRRGHREVPEGPCLGLSSPLHMLLYASRLNHRKGYGPCSPSDATSRAQKATSTWRRRPCPSMPTRSSSSRATRAAGARRPSTRRTWRPTRPMRPKHGIERILAHAPYTLNPASDKQQTRDFALMVLAEDLARMEETPHQLYNMHPGSAVGQTREEAIAKIADALERSRFMPQQTTTLLLETMAGKGSEVGGTFEELAAIIDAGGSGRATWACAWTRATCGTPATTSCGDLDGVLDEFDRVIGLDRLHAIHLNDSHERARLAQGPPCAHRRGADRPRGARRRHEQPAACGTCRSTWSTPNPELSGFAEEIALLRSAHEG